MLRRLEMFDLGNGLCSLVTAPSFRGRRRPGGEDRHDDTHRKRQPLVRNEGRRMGRSKAPEVARPSGRKRAHESVFSLVRQEGDATGQLEEPSRQLGRNVETERVPPQEEMKEKPKEVGRTPRPQGWSEPKTRPVERRPWSCGSSSDGGGKRQEGRSLGETQKCGRQLRARKNFEGWSVTEREK
jgi:hypothetical protein